MESFDVTLLGSNDFYVLSVSHDAHERSLRLIVCRDPDAVTDVTTLTFSEIDAFEMFQHEDLHSDQYIQQLLGIDRHANESCCRYRITTDSLEITLCSWCTPQVCHR